MERRETQRRNPKICVKISFKLWDDSELDMFRERMQEIQQKATTKRLKVYAKISTVA